MWLNFLAWFGAFAPGHDHRICCQSSDLWIQMPPLSPLKLTSEHTCLDCHGSSSRDSYVALLSCRAEWFPLIAFEQAAEVQKKR